MNPPIETLTRNYWIAATAMRHGPDAISLVTAFRVLMSTATSPHVPTRLAECARADLIGLGHAAVVEDRA